MNSYTDKIQQNKKQTTPNTVTQKKNNSTAALSYKNISSTAVTQMQLQKIANNSLQVKQAMQLQTMANANFSMPIQKKGVKEEELQMKSIPIQKQGIEEEELQMKAIPIQKKGVEEEELQMKAIPVQKKGIEEEEPLQGKFALPIQKKENNTGLPDNLKSGIENLSGYAMDDVKVHYNSDKPAQLQAHAYAQGTDIHIASGQEKHLPHEAWHVVQQKQGRVQPTLQMKGNINVNDDAELENEADVMGTKALGYSGDNTIKTNTSRTEVAGRSVQRMVALALDDKDTEDDLVIMTNLKYALDYAGGPVVDFGVNADFSTMESNEDLMLLEHGAPGKIKNFTASQIVDILTADGKAVPAHIAGITVLACSAGLPETTGDESTSLVAAIAKGLSAKGLDLVVDGKKGLALTSPSTGERAVKPDEKDNYMKLQHQIVIKYGFDAEIMDLTKPGYKHHIPKYGEKIVTKLKSANLILQEDYAKNPGLYAKDPKEMNLEEKARHMSRITRPFYEELVNTANNKGFLYAEFEGEQYALGSLIINY
ncbi:DUF4157 domain-containing protein [Flavobacterium chilense]|uniref:eCIS core domain-containing protein n=1 Tax=Flavobacterium chilense TaxID=946677 RepID=A0A1M7FHV6_9FLAO|nr:DUF4157 domain-containing protein [Flavobacterium chilense]SHM03570.1 protein of unknown function [Flavobacterium chilense]